MPTTWSDLLTAKNNPMPSHRRVRPEPPRPFDTLATVPSGLLDAINRVQGLGMRGQDGSGASQPAAELIAHVVAALSGYLRQLRQDGRGIPPQLEELTTFLAPFRQGAELLPRDRSRAAFDSSTASRRLLVTKSEAARQLAVSLRTIERLISAGRLPLVHVEGAARIRVADLKAYVQSLDADDRTAPSCSEE